jgi:hypothetical protein
MMRFLVLAGLAGRSAHPAADRVRVVEHTSPCPAIPTPSASVSAPAVVPVEPVSSARVVAPKRERAVVEAFDCFSTLEEKRSESLRAWASGGPDGAAWNVEGAPLRCELKLTTPCTGAVTLRVLGNTKRLAQRAAALTVGANTLELALPSPAWEKAVEASPAPYSALLISVSGVVSCSTDDGGAHLAFADAFMAGFSGGE